MFVKWALNVFFSLTIHMSHWNWLVSITWWVITHHQSLENFACHNISVGNSTGFFCYVIINAKKFVGDYQKVWSIINLKKEFGLKIWFIQLMNYSCIDLHLSLRHKFEITFWPYTFILRVSYKPFKTLMWNNKKRPSHIQQGFKN